MMADLNVHDCQILESLTHDVRFFCLEHIARTWFDSVQSDAESAVARLESGGLVRRETHLVTPEMRVTGAELSWKPGEEVPDMRPIAYRLKKRWAVPKEELELVFPTADACRFVGGTRVVPRPGEFSHDLLGAAVFLYQRETKVADGLCWVSGDILRTEGRVGEFGGKVPDAVLCDESGSVRKLIEIAGAYSRQKLESLHAEYQSFPYEIY